MSNKSHPTIAGDCVKDYLKRYQSLPSIRLAKIILENEPKLFNNIETIRTRIRYYRSCYFPYNI